MPITKLIPTLVSAIAAIWVVAIALVSVQNATPVSLMFLGFSSIQIPVGLVLATSTGLGMIGGALALSLFSKGRNFS
ncbi:lipopolysaccharide assembly protein LapA domain-containing protein [Laspinema sp. D1]|uniref:Lipopolysaccharide assembly protein LapA domain-containing protein n=1 Tax=Laspinema palackyanum D2a TaxID=2953684 RepID=A0ABT2MRI6_9CYAN|nr:lipopolysaccharide assembly protein LapA domain-containing protein [Laspinema sp. D2b]MCT7966600.1 lipopolysaccharide assembly protein LapA domain-containing protein [Laspinema sp. D2a]